MVVSLYAWFWEQFCITFNTSVNRIKFRASPSAFRIVSLEIWFMMLDFQDAEEMLKICGKQKSQPVLSHGRSENWMCIPCIVKVWLPFLSEERNYLLAWICSYAQTSVRFKIQSHFVFPYQLSSGVFCSVLFFFLFEYFLNCLTCPMRTVQDS